MRFSSISRHFHLSLSIAMAGLFSVSSPECANAAVAGGIPGAARTGDAGLFPDAAEPTLVPKASLRGLLEALSSQDRETVTQMTWQLLAAMWKARDAGAGPSEYLAAGYRAEHLKGTDAATVQNCLLSAWTGAQSMALFTPENIASMERGASPLATRGLERGKPVTLDTSNLPTLAVTTKPLPRNAAAVPALPANTLPTKTVAAPIPEPVAPPPAFVIKTFDVRLHELVPLDAYGLQNMDFRLESVNPSGSVSFLFGDRTIHHFGLVNRWEGLNRVNPNTGLVDAVNRMTNFTTELIPDTVKHGVKLLTLPFATVYLDENLGAQITFRIIIRVASEALNLDQLPPEKRKQYEIRNP